MPQETVICPPKEAAGKYIEENFTQSLSVYFEAEEIPENFYPLRDNPAFDFWKSDEDNY